MFRAAHTIKWQLQRFVRVFGFFSANSLPTGVYVTDANYADGAIVDADVIVRIQAVATELADAIEHRRSRITPALRRVEA